MRLSLLFCLFVCSFVCSFSSNSGEFFILLLSSLLWNDFSLKCCYMNTNAETLFLFSSHSISLPSYTLSLFESLVEWVAQLKSLGAPLLIYSSLSLPQLNQLNSLVLMLPCVSLYGRSALHFVIWISPPFSSAFQIKTFRIKAQFSI